MVSRRHRYSLLNVLMLTSVVSTLFLFYYVHPFSSTKKSESQEGTRSNPRQGVIDPDRDSEPEELDSSNYQQHQLTDPPVVFVDSNGIANPDSVEKTGAKNWKGQSQSLTPTSSTTAVGGEDLLDEGILYTLDQTDARLISYIKKHHLIPPSKLAYSNMTHNGYHSNSYSNYVQQLFTKKGSNFKGVFIEAGAYDGEVASNSLFLEETGWSGLLVECNPLLLPKLMKKNRKAWIAPVCLSTTNTSKLMNFSTLSEWPASAKLGRPLNETEMKKHGIDWVQNKTWINYQIPCFPLYSIIKATSITEVDFLSLDVEGAEIDILKSFPYDKFKIKTMIVEVHTYSEKEKDDLRQFVEKNGYAVKRKLENDDVYILKSEGNLG